MRTRNMSTSSKRSKKRTKKAKTQMMVKEEIRAPPMPNASTAGKLSWTSIPARYAKLVYCVTNSITAVSCDGSLKTRTSRTTLIPQLVCAVEFCCVRSAFATLAAMMVSFAPSARQPSINVSSGGPSSQKRLVPSRCKPQTSLGPWGWATAAPVEEQVGSAQSSEPFVKRGGGRYGMHLPATTKEGSGTNHFFRSDPWAVVSSG
mmetsp:Transcript_118749/g.335943  ORF Transcript_118749/g.335943 Transcript_118749/m.335943 type:complete len:204 (-) Transcript_118749:338-949(-)